MTHGKNGFAEGTGLTSLTINENSHRNMYKQEYEDQQVKRPFMKRYSCHVLRQIKLRSAVVRCPNVCLRLRVSFAFVLLQHF